MKWNEDPHQKLLVFCFQRQGEPVNNRSQDLKKLSYSVKVFGLINKPKVEGRVIMCLTKTLGPRCTLDRLELIKFRTEVKTNLLSVKLKQDIEGALEIVF